MTRSERALTLSIIAAALGILPAGDADGSSPWVPPAGQTIVRVTYAASRSSEVYCPFSDTTDCPKGETRTYPFGGEAVTRAAVLEVERGVRGSLAVDVRLTYLSLQFNDANAERSERGFSDLTAGARATVVAHGAWRLTPFVSAKLPLSRTTLRPDAIPIGEAQADVEAGVYGGVSLWPWPAYVSARISHRSRFENASTGRDPGDELGFSLEAGLGHRGLRIKTGVDGLIGGVTQIRSDGDPAAIESEPGKRVARGILGLSVDLDATTSFGVTGYVPMAGENFPTGASIVISASVQPGGAR